MTRFANTFITITISLALAACSDDPIDANTDGGALADGGAIDAATVDSGDVDAGSDAGLDPCAVTSLLVTTSNFSDGFLGRVSTATNSLVGAPTASSDQDSIPMRSGCTTFLLEHGAGNVRVQSASDPTMTAHTIALAEPSTAYGTNPLSIASVSATKAYVTQYALNTVAIINPTMDGNGAVTGQIDLAAFLQAGDVDGHVDMSSIAVVGSKAYVALGNYYFGEGGRAFAGPSVIAVIDTATDMLIDQDTASEGVQGIALNFPNPVDLVVAGTSLFVQAPGLDEMQDGGIEVIDTTTGSLTIVVSEDTLDSTLSLNPGGMAFANGGLFVITDWDFLGGGTVQIIETDGAVGVELTVADAMSVRVSGNALYVAAGTPAALRVFNTATNADVTPVSGPIMVGSLGVYGVAEAP
ncbi:MAG: hypothetical protein IPK60_23455 [Sandaracinaceae bacterium]|nr:hypothetical protein [Sandaracinaceae bacterium]